VSYIIIAMRFWEVVFGKFVVQLDKDQKLQDSASFATKKNKNIKKQIKYFKRLLVEFSPG